MMNLSAKHDMQMLYMSEDVNLQHAHSAGHIDVTWIVCQALRFSKIYSIIICQLPWQQNTFTYTCICCSVKWCHTQNSPLSVSAVPVTPQRSWSPWHQRTRHRSWGRPTLGGPHYRTWGRTSAEWEEQFSRRVTFNSTLQCLPSTTKYTSIWHMNTVLPFSFTYASVCKY